MKELVCGAALILALSCNATENTTNSVDTIKSGILGTVVRSPVRPHSVPGQSNSRPVTNAVVIVSTSSNHHEVTRGTTDQNGHFAFALPAGNYTVSLAPESRPRFRNPKKVVEVVDNQTTNIVLNIDTGIRAVRKMD